MLKRYLVTSSFLAVLTIVPSHVNSSKAFAAKVTLSKPVVTNLVLQIRNLDTKVTNLEVKTSIIDENLKNLTLSAATLQSSVTAIQANVTSLENSYSNINGSISELNAKVADLYSMQNSLSGLNTQVSDLKIADSLSIANNAALTTRVSVIENTLAKQTYPRMPILLDANGATIGTLVQFGDSYGSRVRVYDTKTNAIYGVDFLSGQFIDTPNNGIYFSDLNCTGDAYGDPQFPTLNAISGGSQNRFFVFKDYTTQRPIFSSKLFNGVCVYERTSFPSVRVTEIRPSFTFPLMAPLSL